MRKPNPGMIFKAAEKHNIDLKHSIMIGDNTSDIKAGHNAGVGTNILFNENKVIENVINIKYLQEAIDYL